ncbi:MULTISPECIES: hypothetical protein [unclassified Bartonella]|uniref:hypothetical protein n=1 Tax=unclassified Bartonella TaxID=2645622 RepID=UPI0023612A2B|nr:MULTISPECIES: hypothetical protein [unclassified Bartonella]
MTITVQLELRQTTNISKALNHSMVIKKDSQIWSDIGSHATGFKYAMQASKIS